GVGQEAFPRGLLTPDERILADVPTLRVAAGPLDRNRDLEAALRDFELGRPGQAFVFEPLQAELGERPRPAAVFFPVATLGVVNLVQQVARGPRWIRPKLGAADLRRRKLYSAPAPGPVQVDHPLRRPAPFVFFSFGPLAILAVDALVPPLHA